MGSTSTDLSGNRIEDRHYNQKDFDRSLVIDERTRRVAQWVSDYLKASGDRFQKTIVFCVDTEHAARMRQALINENADFAQQDSRYVMRITGDDPDGQAQLDNFIDPESRYPVIVTTSRLLSTGVDAQTCRLIVLEREVGSMTEFKQILGRGTRVHEETKKYYFTLVDFRKATNHFADPDFDGEPVQIYEPGEDDPPLPPAAMFRRSMRVKSPFRSYLARTRPSSMILPRQAATRPRSLRPPGPSITSRAAP